MNALAGLASIAASLYLAARHRGWGKPLEEQPYAPQKHLASVNEESEDRASIFLRTAQSAIARAAAAAELDDCRTARVLLLAAQAALAQTRAHSFALPYGEHRSHLDAARVEAEGKFHRVQALYREKCVSFGSR